MLKGNKICDNIEKLISNGMLQDKQNVPHNQLCIR
jgi:hypothetical protein